MTDTNARDEDLSLEGLLGCVRRILIQEEAARKSRVGGETDLVLTKMLLADGSIVRLEPACRRGSIAALGRNSRDPFARIDALRAHVTALVSV